MEKSLPIMHVYAPLDLYTPRGEIERWLEGLARFVRRYIPDARSVEIRTKLALHDSERDYSFTYELAGITAYQPDGEAHNVVAILYEHLEDGMKLPTNDPNGEWSWEFALSEEDDSLMNELLEPLVWVFANPFAHEPMVVVNLDNLELNLIAVEDVAAMQPSLAPCEGFYPALARNELIKFVRSHVPNARKVRVKYTFGVVEYDDALYPNYELTRIDVERRSGESVRLDDVIEKRAENDPDFVENAPSDPWTEALLEQDATGINELLAPLVRGYANDPNLKNGVIEFVI